MINNLKSCVKIRMQIRNKSLIRVCFCGVILFSMMNSTMCQYSLNEFSLEKGISEWYSKQLGKKNEDIFNGDYYVVKVRSKNDHRFYNDFRWKPGAIEYNGKLYENIDLLYDLMDDLIIVRNGSITKSVPLKPLQRGVSQFIIENNVFINITSENPPPRGAGFYQLLHRGANLLLVRRFEKLETYAKVQSNDFTYLKHGDKYHPIKSRGSLFRLFPEFKMRIKGYIKQKKLRFDSKNFDQSMAIVLDYLENLIVL